MLVKGKSSTFVCLWLEYFKLFSSPSVFKLNLIGSAFHFPHIRWEKQSSVSVIKKLVQGHKPVAKPSSYLKTLLFMVLVICSFLTLSKRFLPSGLVSPASASPPFTIHSLSGAWDTWGNIYQNSWSPFRRVCCWAPRPTAVREELPNLHPLGWAPY